MKALITLSSIRRMFHGKNNTGTIAVVTGGASGIGKAIAAALANSGAEVCIADINTNQGITSTEELNAQTKSSRVSFQECDITEEDRFKGVVETVKKTHGKVDILVNSAAIIDEKKWEKVIDINLKGTIRGTLLGIEHMGKHNGNQGGLIVNLASVNGIGLSPHIPTYGASKHGSIAYSRSLATEVHYKHHGVRINCVCPFGVDTSMVNDVTPDKLFNAEWYNPYTKPSKRMSASKVADVIMDIVKDETRNGETVIVPVDGEAYNIDFEHLDEIWPVKKE